MNIVILTGALQRDPKVGTSAAGKDYAFFTVAVPGYKDSTDYFDVKAFGYAAADVSKLTAGTMIEVVGKLAKEKPREEGSKVWATVVFADKVAQYDPMRASPEGGRGSGRGESQQGRPASERRDVKAEAPPRAEYVPPEPNDDQDLPF